MNLDGELRFYVTLVVGLLTLNILWILWMFITAEPPIVQKKSKTKQ